MIYQTETKPQLWRAVAVFEDRPDQLIYLNRSNTQVHPGYRTAYMELLDEEEPACPHRVAAALASGPDSGRWVHQANLIVPNQERIVPIVVEQQVAEAFAA